MTEFSSWGVVPSPLNLWSCVIISCMDGDTKGGSRWLISADCFLVSPDAAGSRRPSGSLSFPGVDQPMVTRVRSSRGSPSCHPGLRADVSFLSTSRDGVRLVLTDLTSGIKRVWTSRLNVCCHCEWDNDRGFTSWSRYILFFLSGALQQWLCRFKNKCVYPTPFIRVRTSALQTTDRLIITQNTFVNTPDMKMLKIKLKKKNYK